MMDNLKEMQSIDEETINQDDYDVEQLLTVQEDEEECGVDEFKFSFE